MMLSPYILTLETSEIFSLSLDLGDIVSWNISIFMGTHRNPKLLDFLVVWCRAGGSGFDGEIGDVQIFTHGKQAGSEDFGVQCVVFAMQVRDLAYSDDLL